MNWTWNVRSNDGAMNGLEFARCTTAGGFGRVLIHAAPADANVEIIDGNDKVVARATGQGTHLGEYMGIPPTGKRIKVSWIAIYRVADGKLAEHWQQIDELGLRQQLGAVLTLPAA